jgi:hypothetical protein
MRVSVMDAVIRFSYLVLYPHEKGTCYTQVRAEVKRRLPLWGAGKLESLAALTGAPKAPRPFTSGTTLRPTTSRCAKALIHKGQFSRAAMLADSYGMAPPSADTYKALTLLHPPLGVLNPRDLLGLFGEPRLVIVDRNYAKIHVDKVRESIAAATPLTSPHRVDYLEIFARDMTPSRRPSQTSLRTSLLVVFPQPLLLTWRQRPWSHY